MLLLLLLLLLLLTYDVYASSHSSRGDPTQWHEDEAVNGKDPLAQFLHAHRVAQFGGASGKMKSANGKMKSANGQSNGIVGGLTSQKTEWLRRSAEGGFTRAMNEFGMACKDGDGISADRAQAEKWFKRAAEVEPERYSFNYYANYTLTTFISLSRWNPTRSTTWRCCALRMGRWPRE
jgi:TPR repeat protein